VGKFGIGGRKIMAFTNCSVATNNVAALDTLPNDVGGLTPTQLKAVFDKYGAEFVAWFNATHIAEGNAHLADTLPHLMAQSKTANGYVKLPGGVIIQWGHVAATTGSSAIVYPIAFPNASINVAITMLYNVGISYGIIGDLSSKTGFTIFPSDAASNERIWLAIGY
jgi:hypothetical protein